MKHELPAYAVLPPCQVTVVDTYGENEKPNGLTVSWTGIAVSDPPHVMIAVRPGRYSHADLCGRGEFTLNIPSENQMQETDYFGITSGRKTDKFADISLTPVPAMHVHAPMIAECPLSLECQVTIRQDIGSHSMFIAKILAVHADERILDENGKINVTAMRPLSYDHAKFWYLGLGSVLGKAFSAGKTLHKSR
ncbi:MAG: flavin reductase family protein [Methanocalculaceae archaeon]|jgi:flavin reductase (DIM6/NTAB) family NADH-FMN oxidoreductase RutF|nr:flavin reductase family protein [Methanocalculaceae archaeon]